jgi:hypothetical protein
VDQLAQHGVEIAPQHSSWLTELRAAQRPDGAFAQAAGRPANTESTALAVIALDAAGDDPDAVERGRRWLRRRQRQDGGWPLLDGVNEGTWATPWALLALHANDEDSERVRRGVAWLVRREGRTLGLLSSILFWLTPSEETVDLDPHLVGWPWHGDSFSWVEPTSVALLALKRLRASLGNSFPQARVDEGEKLLYDRECADGGWNYGNPEVLGDRLPPYPDSTAIALIALQDRERERNQKSFQALRRLVDDPHASGLALALGSVCLSLYGEEPQAWRRRLAERYERTRFLGETRTLALASLAMTDARALRIG